MLTQQVRFACSPSTRSFLATLDTHIYKSGSLYEHHPGHEDRKRRVALSVVHGN